MELDQFFKSDIVTDIVIAAFKVFIGAIVIFILFKIINIINRKIERRLEKNQRVDPTVVKFLSPLLNKLLKFFILVCYIGFIGIETSSIVAGITSVGLAIGLAMQGALSNFAGGFIILIMRPFKVGDYIETCGESGTVENIEVFYTTLITVDNKVIKIPNGQISSSSVINETSKSKRRVIITISIGHYNEYSRVKETVNQCVDKTGLKLSNTDTFINIVGFNMNSVDISVRVWCKTKDYWDLYFMLQQDIKMELDKENIAIPYSKIDISSKEINKSV